MEINYGRKRSGIKSEIQQKLADWLLTIANENVRELASKNTIVCGGAIASMLLGEQVNDFDIYFRNIETTIAVAQYYVAQFNATNTIESCNDYVPKVISKDGRVIIHMQSAGVAAEGQTAYKYFESLENQELAGNFVNSFVTDEESKEKTKYRPLFLSENAISLSHKVQLITRFYGDPDKIFDNFDFIHAMNYYDNGNNELVLKSEALEALLSRTLIYKGSLFPVASLFRMKKFLKRGWRISAGQILKIAFQVSELNMNDPVVLREQLTGVDIFFMKQLIDALESVDPEKINSAYVSVLIDKIFKE